MILTVSDIVISCIAVHFNKDWLAFGPVNTCDRKKVTNTTSLDLGKR